MTTQVDLSLINAALTVTGSEPISSFEDQSAGGQIAANNYEEKIKSELSSYPWKFAKKFAQLSRLDPDLSGEPPNPWLASYQLPDDMIDGAITSVKVGGYAIDHTVMGDVLLCNADAQDIVILEYLWRVPESKFPLWFRGYMIMRLEAMFLRGVGERYREAKLRDDAADEAYKNCKTNDTKLRTPTDPTLTPGLPKMPRTTLEARRRGTP